MTQRKNYSKSSTPEERIEIACAMFDSYCSKIMSSLPKNLSETEKKQQLFLRLYGNDFDDETKNKILKWITKKI